MQTSNGPGYVTYLPLQAPLDRGCSIELPLASVSTGNMTRVFCPWFSLRKISVISSLTPNSIRYVDSGAYYMPFDHTQTVVVADRLASADFRESR